MVNGKQTYYGLGWQVSEDKKGRRYFGHVGSSVGVYSSLFVYPEQQMVFSILINCTDPKVQETLDEAINQLLTLSDSIV
jgi:serine beta-lactamase-like protein LACTB